MSGIHKGDIGTTFRFLINDCDDDGNVIGPLDLTGLTAVVLRFKKPCGRYVEKTTTPEAPLTSGVVLYVTVADDLDTAGVWKGEVVPDLPDGKWTSSAITFDVKDTI